MKARILGIDYHLPDKAVTNEDLDREHPEWGMEKLYDKSGIATRYISASDETASDLGVEAARKLLQRNLVDLNEIDFLLYCTQSPDYFLPSAACIIQNHLQLGTHIGAFDINLGCSGYIYGLHLAKLLVETGSARTVLFITADTYTKYIHRHDRTVRPLFGDGAAATLVGPSSDGPGEIGHFALGTDGKGANSLIVPAGCFRHPSSADTAREYTDDSGCVRSAANLFMDGRAIFSFAITRIPHAISNLLTMAGLSPDDVDWYVYHQANKYMLENLAQRSGVPWSKM
ncbi:3-oxoacyl-ACP synthase III family protein, partial [Bacteroidota bacterium]